jgi:hypothetical protein
MAIFRHVPILLTLGHSNDGGIGTNIKVVIFFALMIGLFQGLIIEHLVCLRVDWCLHISKGQIWNY